MRLVLAMVPVAVLAAVAPGADGAASPLLQPADACLLAWGDAESLPPDVAKGTRYLWLPNLSPKDRDLWFTVLSGHCNELSTQSDLTPVRAVKGSDGHMAAVYLPDYGWEAKTWDQLADVDTTFYADVVTVETAEEYERQYWPGGYENGKYYEAGWYRVKKAVAKKENRQRVLAPWLVQTPGGKAAVEGLSKYARAPIVNALVFFDNTATSGDGRKPGYYDLLGVKDEKAFQALLGVDLKRDRKFAVELLESVGVSGVTQEPRGIERTEKIGGAYWRTRDIKKGEAHDDKNALRIFGTDGDGNGILKFDASEQYGHLSNGLWATGLFNNGGVRQDSAPDNIAVDAVPILRNNHRVYVNVSCKRCHSNGGLQDVDGWVRGVFTPPPLNLLAGDPKGKKELDYEDVRRLRQQYGRKLEPFIERDRLRYAEALLEITGLTPQAYAVAYLRVWSYAADSLVDAEFACRELGVTTDRLKGALEHQARLGKLDPVAAGLLKGKALPLGTYRELYPILQQYLAGIPK